MRIREIYNRAIVGLKGTFEIPLTRKQAEGAYDRWVEKIAATPVRTHGRYLAGALSAAFGKSDMNSIREAATVLSLNPQLVPALRDPENRKLIIDANARSGVPIHKVLKKHPEVAKIFVNKILRGKYGDPSGQGVLNDLMKEVL